MTNNRQKGDKKMQKKIKNGHKMIKAKLKVNYHSMTA